MLYLIYFKQIKKNTNIKYCFLHQANKLIQTNIEKIINKKSKVSFIFEKLWKYKFGIYTNYYL